MKQRSKITLLALAATLAMSAAATAANVDVDGYACGRPQFTISGVRGLDNFQQIESGPIYIAEKGAQITVADDNIRELYVTEGKLREDGAWLFGEEKTLENDKKENDKKENDEEENDEEETVYVPYDSLPVDCLGESLEENLLPKGAFVTMNNETLYQVVARYDEIPGVALAYVYIPASYGFTPLPLTPTAKPAAATVKVDGEKVAFDAYEIGGYNYFKLRDLGMALKGSRKQFDVLFDAESESIEIKSDQEYQPVGGELKSGAGEETSAQYNAREILFDNKAAGMTVFTIGGNNYLRLRDLGIALDFGIGWDDVTQTITISTIDYYTA